MLHSVIIPLVLPGLPGKIFISLFSSFRQDGLPSRGVYPGNWERSLLFFPPYILSLSGSRSLVLHPGYWTSGFFRYPSWENRAPADRVSRVDYILFFIFILFEKFTLTFPGLGIEQMSSCSFLQNLSLLPLHSPPPPRYLRHPQ